MNLDELRSVQEQERRKDSLQHLRDSFYDDVATYIADLRAARDRRAERVDDPFSDDEVRRMSDEIETAEEVAEALYERRVGKVVKLASFAAAGMPAEEEGMTSQEQALFDDIVGRIERNKTRVLDVIAGDADPNAAADPDAAADDAAAGALADGNPAIPEEAAPDPADVPPAGRSGAADGSPTAETAADDAGVASGSPADGGTLADAMGDDSTPRGGTDPEPGSGDDHTPVPPDEPPAGDAPSSSPDDRPSDGRSDDATAAEPAAEAAAEPPTAAEPTAPAAGGAGAAGADTSRTTLRITEDVGEILGVDEREYDLVAEDVVSLPEANAEPLLRRDAAERLE